MRTTASFAATPRLPDWQSDLNPANKWFRSLFWERTVFSLLAKVEKLPANLQGEIATRVGNYIDLARTAQDDDTLARFIEARGSEQSLLKGLGLFNGTLNRLSAMSVSTAIELSHRGNLVLPTRQSRVRQRKANGLAPSSHACLPYFTHIAGR
jgi:hypothetical protein